MVLDEHRITLQLRAPRGLLCLATIIPFTSQSLTFSVSDRIRDDHRGMVRATMADSHIVGFSLAVLQTFHSRLSGCRRTRAWQILPVHMLR